MLIKKESSRGAWTGLALLALGIAIGILTARRWPRFPRSAGRAPADALAAQLAPAPEGEQPPANGLPTLELTIPEDSARLLQRVRDGALERGVILQEDRQTVPAEVALGSERLPAEIRLKGDWPDHLADERWSYRIRLDQGHLLGMREFSIQAPHTRGYLWEWLLHAAGRREKVLAPRSTFVNVVQNGHSLGVYFLEEHFEKELLESQGRREGPIVIWDESLMWDTVLAMGTLPSKGVEWHESELREPAFEPAEVRAYDEKHLGSIETLNRALSSAVERMRALRALALGDEPGLERLRVLQALEELRGRTLEELVDAERLGCAHALLSVFQVQHSLVWHNMRFYYDLVQDRLEPILFDNAVHEASRRDPVPFRAQGLTAVFAESPVYYDALFTHLGRMLDTAWLDGLFETHAPELARFEAALAAEDRLPAGFGVSDMKQRLRAELLFLRRACLPEDPVNFAASYELANAKANAGAGVIEVQAWATSRSPVLLSGFRFSNGSFTAAAERLAESSGAHLAGSGVVLPSDGRAAVFRFPMDERLANLETVEKLTRAVRDELQGQTALDLDVRALYRLLASQTGGEELLTFRRREPGWDLEQGRPRAGSLEELLERHPFLRYDLATGVVGALPGTWELSGDLVLPAGVGLTLGPGTTLRFPGGAVLLADGPLVFRGTAGAPVVLEPLEGAESWQGIAVMKAGGRSQWEHVIVRDTQEVQRGGWTLTGGVTFYRSPVTLSDCRFEGTLAEDALNVFGADLLFQGLTFEGSASDSFDGDFVTGEIRNSTFQDGAADGLDVSGSDVHIVGCRFLRLGDKGISVGEQSRARIEGGLAEDVSIGVASKDDSDVEVQGLTVRRARSYALAAFVKKAEFGPARLVARGVHIEEAGAGEALAQTGCVLEIEGRAVPTQDVDVEASYEEGVLGQPR